MINQEESIVNLYERFQKFKSLKPFDVSDNIITKVDELYQDLVFQNDLSKLKVSKETKEKIFRQTIQMYLITPKSTGNMDIKFNDDILWKTYQIILDIDICELMLQGEKQILINLRSYNLQGLQVELKRYKFCLHHKRDSLKIYFSKEDKQYLEKWFEQIDKCVNFGQKTKRLEVKVEQMTRQINFEVLKNLDRNKNNDNHNTNMSHSQEITQQKHYSITYKEEDNIPEQQPPIINNTEQEIQQQNQQKIILQKDMYNSEIIQSTPMKAIKSETFIKEKIIIELPESYKDLKEKLNYQYLTDDSDFILFSFDDNIRIMQNRSDCYNFRVYLPINDCNISNLLQGLFDFQSTTKWNKQIKNISQVSQINTTQVQLKETRAQLSFFYQPRYFEYQKQFFCCNDEIYFIDKSIDQKTYAQIDWHICAIFTKQKQPKLLIVDTRTINGGFITQQQDFQLTTLYLKEYAHFIQFSMEFKLDNKLPQIIQQIYDIFESHQIQNVETQKPEQQQVKQQEQQQIKQQEQQQYQQQIKLKEQKVQIQNQSQQILLPPQQINRKNNVLFRSQQSYEQQEQYTRQDSISYLKIKEKYMPKLSDIQEMPSKNKPEDLDIQISQRIGVSITVQEPQVSENNNNIIHPNSKSLNLQSQTNNKQQIQQTTLIVQDKVQINTNHPEMLNEQIIQEQLKDLKQEIKLDDISGDEADIPFTHQDIYDINERSSLMLNSDQNYQELMQFVLSNQMYHTQLHPYNLNIKQWNEQEERVDKIDGRHYFYKDEWQYDTKKGYLKYINTKKLEAQKRVLKYILSKIGSNLLKGKSILSISLPVYVFEKRSNLQRFGASFALAPHFFDDVAQQPEKQMAAVMAFSLSFTILYLNLEKPFNPILGETCQLWIKGCPVYLEQISHHPPIAAFIMYGRGYKIYGNLESTASIGPNTVTGGNEGKIIVEFPNSKIQFSYCKGYVTGITFGDRYFYTEGQQIYFDHKNEIMGELIFNPQKKGKNQYDYFEGKIYQVNQQIIQKYKKEGKIKMANVQAKVLSEIEGNWQQEETMKVNGKIIFNILKDFPYLCKPEKKPLASDSQYREDLIGWQLDDFDLSMKFKEILEQKQRKDKKLRH